MELERKVVKLDTGEARMKIVMSCKHPKKCAVCKNNIYTNEIRHVRNNGDHQHIKRIKYRRR